MGLFSNIIGGAKDEAIKEYLSEENLRRAKLRNTPLIQFAKTIQERNGHIYLFASRFNSKEWCAGKRYTDSEMPFSWFYLHVQLDRSDYGPVQGWFDKREEVFRDTYKMDETQYKQGLDMMLSTFTISYSEAERMIGENKEVELDAYGELLDFVVDAEYDPENEAIDASLFCYLPAELNPQTDEYWKDKLQAYMMTLRNRYGVYVLV